ncbi:MAG TPA: transposase, partial [Bryobacteraceae bacterium]
NWVGKEKEQKQVYGNRRRMSGRRGKDLQKLRTELTERSFAHMYETGGMRRTHLKGQKNILKRLLFHAVGFNLALLVRKSSGIGKPRTLQGLSDAILLVQIAMTAWAARWIEEIEDSAPASGLSSLPLVVNASIHSEVFSHFCHRLLSTIPYKDPERTHGKRLFGPISQIMPARERAELAHSGLSRTASIPFANHIIALWEWLSRAFRFPDCSGLLCRSVTVAVRKGRSDSAALLTGATTHFHPNFR